MPKLTAREFLDICFRVSGYGRFDDLTYFVSGYLIFVCLFVKLTSNLCHMMCIDFYGAISS